jgi:hypothetical protein
MGPRHVSITWFVAVLPVLASFWPALAMAQSV